MIKKNQFHSGKRLALARELQGLGQKEIIEQEGFPKKADLRTIGKWEQKGIPPKEIVNVAHFFNIDIWAFTNVYLTEEDFLELLTNPESLKEMKIKYTTQIGKDTGEKLKTNLLLLKAKVGKEDISIDSEIIQQALTDRASVEENFIIDFGDREIYSQKSWEEAAEYLKSKWSEFTEILQTQKTKHISLFAWAPMPLLILLGRKIGTSRQIDFYRHDRRNGSWKWEEGKGAFPFKNVSWNPSPGGDKSPVAVVLSISGKIKEQHVKETLENQGVSSATTYEMTIPNPNRNFLQFRNQLKEFQNAYTELLGRIGKNHSPSVIHLFPAIPAPFAIECGRMLDLSRIDSALRIYDATKKENNKQTEHFRFICELE